MYFTKTRKFILAVLVAVVAFTFVGLFYQEKVYAISASDTVAYPFATEDYALANAPTFTGVAAQTDGDTWHWAEQIFDNPVDLTGASYVGIEFENVKGNPGLTIGVMSNGQRFGTYVDGKPLYFVNETGTVTELSVLYGAVTLGVNAKGMILLPLSSLAIVGWGDQSATLSHATSFFFETNGRYNWDFQFKAGEVCYYNGDPVSASAIKVLDLATEIKKQSTSANVFTATFPEKATDTTKNPYSFAYPFATGEAALANAPTLTGVANQQDGDTWHWAEQIFDKSVDLTAATHVAIEFENVKGNAGLTIGVMSNGQRFGTYVDGKPVYMVNEAGDITELKVLYGSVNLGANAKGVIVLPLSSLAIVGWGDQSATLSNATSFFFETNGKYNWDFQFKVGEVCYYTEDPLKGAQATEILDLTNGVKKANTTANVFTLEFPESSTVDNIAGMTAAYPFATGEKAFENAMIWVGTSVGDSSDNWQTFKVGFDEATDLTNASYIAVHYYAKTGVPGITYGIENNGTRHSIVGSSGEDVYMLMEDGTIKVASTIIFDSANVSNSGCLLIPMRLIKHQFGDNAEAMKGARQLLFTTNSRYNWNFEIGVGEVGYYTGQPCDENFTFHKLVDLSQGDKEISCSVTSDLEANRSTMYCNKSEKMVYGDTTLVFTATGKVDGQLVPWDGGAAGVQTMTKDSYGKDALLLACTGPREGADAYTAFTIADGVHYDWSQAKGVTLWARNDSDAEVSFNLEIDVLSPGNTESRGRFNILQGNRFWLYDVKTGEQRIYMTRPVITLPVGFEGWVRIPFTAFAQAPWSMTDPNYGTFPIEYFMTEGCYVPYVGLTIYSGNYTNKPFAVNNLGSYTVEPSFVSALVPASDVRKDIKTLMGLE